MKVVFAPFHRDTARLPVVSAMQIRSALASLTVKMTRAACVATLAASIAATGVASAVAQGRVPIVRDAEIEALVRDYARPILKAAGLSKARIDIILVNDQRFNAFVAQVGRQLAGGRRSIGAEGDAGPGS